MQADLILRNARVYTGDPLQPWASAVACRGGFVLAVDGYDELSELVGTRTQIVDAAGRLVLPGFTDAHVHFLQYAIRQQEVNLFDVRDFGEVRRRVRDVVRAAEPGDWVKGWGWQETHWDVAPSRELLDDLAPDTPVVLARMDMHSWWVNTAALERAGITRNTPDPPRGQIERDAEGEPTGLLREWDAIKLVEKHIPDPSPETLRLWLRDAIDDAHRLGLTGIHDQRTENEGTTSFRLFQALHRGADLDLRVHMNIAAGYIEEAARLGLQPGFGNDRLWIGHVKVFADGSMGSRTARMIEPYVGEADYRGVIVTRPDELWELASRVQDAGFSLSVHAIGDYAVREVLDVLSEFQADAKASPPRLPHRIEHVQVIHLDDLPRLGRYGVVASMQPVHLQSDWETADRVWGQRGRYAYAFRSLLDAGTRLALGSDAPVAPLNPMLGIQAAVTRQDQRGEPAGGWYPEEAIDVEQAVRGYTLGPAYAAGKRDLQGSIAPGKWADMIVLSRNIFDIPADEIAEVAVDMTIFDGHVVFHG
jgi:predicted amidohydrolase YtcJ